MIIALGTQNRAKVAACKNAFGVMQRQFDMADKEILFIPLATTTSVPDMPLTQTDMKKGARQRALFVYKDARQKHSHIDFALGLEGGVYRQKSAKESYLQNWVYAFDGKRGHFGSSASLPLPQAITRALYDEGRELAEVMDTLSGLSDVRSANGAFGILTHDLIARSASFEMAVICALTPFFNKEYYKEGSYDYR